MTERAAATIITTTMIAPQAKALMPRFILDFSGVGDGELVATGVGDAVGLGVGDGVAVGVDV